jgi:DNA polymerase III alpha subunit (gram-positive type)
MATFNEDVVRRQGNYICIDTETSGLELDCNVLTAYFIILDSAFNEVASLDLKIRHPFYKINPKALQVNKINLVDHDQVSMDKLDARLSLEKFLNTYKQNSLRFIPLGHNINFDINMLKSNGILTQDVYQNYFSPNVLDTIVLAQFLKTIGKIPSRQSISLVNLCNYFGIDTIKNLDSHNAECDIRMTIALFKQIQMMCNPSNNEESGLKKRKI